MQMTALRGEFMDREILQSIQLDRLIRQDRAQDRPGRIDDDAAHTVPGCGELDQIETAKRGNLLFYRETDLEPGQYTMDSIAYDATNNQSSVGHHQLTVPDSDQTKLRISNLIVVAKAQKVSATDSQTNPFRVGELMLYPNLGEPLHKAGSKGLSMFLTIYPPKGSTTAPKMSIELAQAGQALGQLPVQLPAPDQNGRIQYTGTIPIDAFPPGEYELKAMVTDGITKTTRSERFTVQP